MNDNQNLYTGKVPAQEKTDIRDKMYDDLSLMIKECMGVEPIEVQEGLLLQHPRLDIVVKVILKTERVDVDEEKEVIAEKAKAKADRKAKADAKKAKDEAKRKAKEEGKKGEGK